MTIHYHGTPITPMSKIYELAGRFFCVSHAQQQDIRRAHQIGQGVMLDNGAFTLWQQGSPTDWPAYYAWADEWLGPSTWAVIPDVIDGSEEEQAQLIAAWPHGDRGAPVWHMNESTERLIRLTEEWPLICMGSTAQYAVVMSGSWQAKMDEVWNAIAKRHRRLPRVHMLRGMQCAGERWPFASLDSTDIARNHNRPQNGVRAMADRWDAVQCPTVWNGADEQRVLPI